MALSFNLCDASGVVLSHWKPQVSGDYANDCARGAQCADELIAEIRETGRTPMLGWVVGLFGRDPALKAAETGFLQRLSENL